MSKLIDRIVLISIIFIISILWLTYLSKSVTLSIGLSALLCIIVAILIKPREKNKKIKAEDYVPKLSAMKSSELNNLILSVLSDKCAPKITSNNLIVINENELVLPIIRISEVSVDEIRRLSEKTKKKGFQKLILVIASYDKINFAKISPYLATPVEFISFDNVICALNKINALPPLNKAKIKKQKYRELFASALKRKNGKYFLFSGLTMAFLAVFTPLTLYYLIFSTLTLVLAVLCFLKKAEKNPSLLK